VSFYIDDREGEFLDLFLIESEKNFFVMWEVRRILVVYYVKLICALK